MDNQGTGIHFRKTLYFKMVILTIFLSFAFLGALFSFYKVSRIRFEEELTFQSSTLTEQICQNVEVSLKELAEKTLPLATVNERFSPLLRQNSGSPLVQLRIKSSMEELISVSHELNWMAIVDTEETVYFSQKEAYPKNMIPREQKLLGLFAENENRLLKQRGNIIWMASEDSDGLIFMRRIFDSDAMVFNGCVIAEVRHTALNAIFKNINVDKVGNFTLYDENDEIVFTTFEEEFLEPSHKKNNYLYAEYPLEYGELKLVHIVDLKEKNRRFSELLYLMVGICLAVLVLIVVVLWFMFGNMAKNLNILLGNINRVSHGEFELEQMKFSKGDELDLLAHHIQEMSGRIKDLMEQVVRDRENRQKREYQLLQFKYHALQAQVNPHFLFNILQSINGIAQLNGDNQVSQLIGMLSKFFRGSIDRWGRQCEVREEIEYVKNYMELYRNIYPDRLEIKWDIDETLMGVNIPTYILQPIVENALVHGMEPLIGVCTIRITVKEEDGRLLIRVWNNGEGIPPERLKEIVEGTGSSKRIGIQNVKERIQMMCGQDYGMTIKSEHHQYTEVSLILPLD